MLLGWPWSWPLRRERRVADGAVWACVKRGNRTYAFTSSEVRLHKNSQELARTRLAGSGFDDPRCHTTPHHKHVPQEAASTVADGGRGG